MSMKNGPSAIPWKQIALESAFVVLGVVLALAANEWRNTRADRAAGVRAANAIREELKLNREAVHGSLQYHIQVSDSLIAFDRRGPRPGDAPGYQTFPRGFISPASSSVLSTAWEVAGTTGAINHVPYDEVLLMSHVYDKQEAYKKQTNTAGDLIYKTIYESGTDGVRRNYRNLNGILQTFVYIECDLLGQYDEALATLGDQGNGGNKTAAAFPERCTYYAPRG